MAFIKPQKLNLSELEIPEKQKRRGSFVVRMALQRVALRQNPRALKAAARMVIMLPVIQAALLVGVLNAEWWMMLLGLEGLLIAWLAAAQLSRPNVESKLIGYGIALMNAALLGAAGAFIGSHVFWVTGVFAILPVTYLVFARTGPLTTKLAWAGYVLPLLLLILGSGISRYALVRSETEEDPKARLMQLEAAWWGLQLRGGNGTERALIRLRQSQAAFGAGEFQRSFEYADRAVYDSERRVIGVPESEIGSDLLDSLMRIKAQAFYNARWDKNGDVFTPIAADPLPDDILNDPTVNVRWAW